MISRPWPGRTRIQRDCDTCDACSRTCSWRCTLVPGNCCTPTTVSWALSDGGGRIHHALRRTRQRPRFCGGRPRNRRNHAGVSRAIPGRNADGASTTPFRRWMAERLTVAQRAVDAARAGHVNPTPGKHCSLLFNRSFVRCFRLFRRRFLMVEFNNSQRLGLDLDRHIALDAGAGTGKTTVMAERYACSTCLQPSSARRTSRHRGRARPCPDLVHCGHQNAANRPNGLAGLAALRGRRHHLHP